MKITKYYNTPTADAHNAVFIPSNKDGKLPSTFETSNSYKPFAIPTKVKKIPVVISIPGAAN